ncbi:hypothetical protein [Psychrobacillus vulpis]|uniref:HEPN domain-containing protein n=1 Tax=Psychrobacillus vulpis TaxID=2325572 RepID=A0A544TFY3_9BACI|nr:hypothetical protein [Psychrobacillus vulpis]TQR16330.1 hypothetical protein FG384_18905 [Psychrobacillus vulpis]
MNGRNWPRKEADFEFVGKDSLHVLKVKNSENLQEEFFQYAKNFMSAANVLINHTLSSIEHPKRDFWFFAMVYLYRQSLELMLKSIAFKYIINNNDRKNYIGKVRHNLKFAFDEILELINEDVINMKEDKFDWLNEFLTNISEVDEQSDLFRYPIKMNMQGSFTDQIHINLYALGVNMNSAYKLLEGILHQEIVDKEFSVFEPVLLIEGGSYYEKSVIWSRFGKEYEFYPYVKGYMESAVYLFEVIKENVEKDYLFLPMCYLYRNGIELALKRILIEGCQYDSVSAAKIMRKKKHSILGIWNSVKEDIVLHSNAPAGDTTINNVEIYINQLHNKIDQTSTRFRYPVDKDLKFHFKKEEKYDLFNISSYFNDLFTFLDSVDGMLSQIKEWQAEMRDYYSE